MALELTWGLGVSLILGPSGLDLGPVSLKVRLALGLGLEPEGVTLETTEPQGVILVTFGPEGVTLWASLSRNGLFKIKESL